MATTLTLQVDAEGVALITIAVPGRPMNVITPELESELAAAMLKPIVVMCKKTNRAAIGVDVSEGLSIKLRFLCASGADAADVDDGCQALAKLAKTVLDESADIQTEESAVAGVKLGGELVNSLMLVRGAESGTSVVEVRMKLKTGIAGLLKTLDADVKAK